MPRNPGNPRMDFRWEDDWRKVKLMEWLLTAPHEREPRSKEALAELLQVDRRTLNGWSQHAQFRKDWEKRVGHVIGDPERAQRIMDRLYFDATDPKSRTRVQAAKLYLEATNAIKPPPVEITVKRPTDLTDDELDALLAQGAAQLREEREKQPQAAVDEDDATAPSEHAVWPVDESGEPHGRMTVDDAERST